MTLFHRLANRPLRDIAGRGLQHLRARAERFNLPTGTGLPAEEELESGAPAGGERWIEAFRSSRWPRPSASLEDVAEAGALVEGRWPEESLETVRRAERILDGRFDLLGYRGLNFGDPVDWQLDPVTGIRAPSVHWSRVPYLDPDAVGDHKLIWELNRHQWFLTLGRAYSITGEERFAEAFRLHLSRWMDENPVGMGINWASSLEVSLRAIAWGWALQFFRDSPQLDESLFRRALRFLTAHGRHVDAYLSTWFSPNTHLTGEALGLVYLGTLFPALPEAGAWLRRGLDVLVSELSRQLLSDGVYFEHATWYHRYTIDFYLHLLLLSHRHGLDAGQELEPGLERGLEHLMWLVRPDGTAPRMGDDDGGRLLFLDERDPRDFRSTLATGAVLYGRGDWAHVAGAATQETFWLLGRAGLDAFDDLDPSPPTRTDRGFPKGGIFVARDGWSETSTALWIRCGSPPRLDGHAHADALSFDLTWKGVPVLVDPGTGSYSDRTLRNRLRSSPAHNTLTLGSASSSVPDTAPFAWRDRAHCQVDAWYSGDRFTFFRGRHDGFRQRDMGGDHVRSLFFAKGRGCVFLDRIDDVSKGPPTVHLQFAPSVELERVAEGIEARRRAQDGPMRAGLRVSAFGVRSGEIEQRRVSPLYGVTEPAPALRLCSPQTPRATIVTFLTGPETRVKAVSEARGGRAWRVKHPTSDSTWALVLDGTPDGPDAGGVTSDFDWLWAEEAPVSASGVRELVLISGTRVLIHGQEVVRAPREVPWIVLEFTGRELHVQAAPGSSFHVRNPAGGAISVGGSPIAPSGAGGWTAVRR